MDTTGVPNESWGTPIALNNAILIIIRVYSPLQHFGVGAGSDSSVISR